MLLEYQCIDVAPHTVLIDILPACLHVLPQNGTHIIDFLEHDLVGFEKKSQEWVEIEILMRNLKREVLGLQKYHTESHRIILAHAEMAFS